MKIKDSSRTFHGQQMKIKDSSRTSQGQQMKIKDSSRSSRTQRTVGQNAQIYLTDGDKFSRAKTRGLDVLNLRARTRQASATVFLGRAVNFFVARFGRAISKARDSDEPAGSGEAQRGLSPWPTRRHEINAEHSTRSALWRYALG